MCLCDQNAAANLPLVTAVYYVEHFLKLLYFIYLCDIHYSIITLF